jgi:adenylate cyclase
VLIGASLTLMHLIFPDSMERIWRGQFQLWKFYVVTAPLVIFELTVLWLLQRRIALNLDVPVVRRYISALIETSLPTIALAIQTNAMGRSGRSVSRRR